ncbi:unnamed protein product [Adineta steineri]|uniref:Uncharacterized protein n=1 Tax=Adineta steineri TaxID=433720 RepID=A0A815GDU4_9BILA|nr:unnamed protein product [Adineta steineri]
MSVSLMFERINNHSCSFPHHEEKQLTHRKSYYKFYQLELRQLLTENRFYQEQDAKSTKSKQQSKIQINNNKKISKEYMDRIRDKSKLQLKNSDNDKKVNNLISINKRNTKDSVIFTITSTNIPNTSTAAITTESKLKSVLKPKQSPSSTKRHHVINTLTSCQKLIPIKSPIEIPIIEINDTDDDLLKSNLYSYTEALSSSQDHIYSYDRHAHQSILNSMMAHFNSYTPSDISKWDLLRDFNNKFSASMSSQVYRNFERIIL